jgi:DNA mismatch repair ATPase MutS
MRELDSQLGDIPEQIADIERAFFSQIQAKLTECSRVIFDAVDIIAELDWYLYTSCKFF